jgi:heparan-alpha-glucosaminide N-acetyltransferase
VHAHSFVELTRHWREWSFMLLVLLTHTLVTFFLDVPGCGRGYLGPGGIGNYGKFKDCTGGAAGYIDVQVLGINHIYGGPTCSGVYRTGSYDPEGILGCLTSAFMCFLGAQASRVLQYYSQPGKRLMRWAAWGVLLGLLAVVLTGGTRDQGAIPINKNLWSMSFIFALSGFGFIVLSFMYMLVDVKKVWSGAPVVFLGLNSIGVYCGHEILHRFAPFSFVPPDQVHKKYPYSGDSIASRAIFLPPPMNCINV